MLRLQRIRRPVSSLEGVTGPATVAGIMREMQTLPPIVVVIQPEGNVGHARAAAAADGPLYRSEHPARAPGQHLIGR